MSQPYIYTDEQGLVVGPNGDGVYANATTCKKAPWVENSGALVFVLFYAFSIVVLLVGIRWLVKRILAARRLEQERVQAAVEAGVELSWADHNSRKQSKGFTRMVFVWIVVAVVAELAAAIVLVNSMQQELSVPENDAIADSNNFLKPFMDVFQFFEDGMTVRIGQAVGASRYSDVGHLLKWGAFGGTLSGLVAAGISALVTLIPPAFKFFVPDKQGAALPVACPFLPSNTEELQALAVPYWLLSSFAWPALFVQKGCIGVFVGSGETQNFCLAIMLATAVGLLLYFVLIGRMAHTTVMGIIALVPSYLFVFIAVAVFLQKKYWERFQLRASMFSEKSRKVAITAFKDGVALMLKDLCLTVQTSTTNMLAARLGLGEQYQLSIFNTVQSSFGYVASTGGGSAFPALMGYTIRLVGSRMLGQGKGVAFVYLCRAFLLGAVLFGAITTLVMLVTMSGSPYYFASDDVCKYQERSCSLGVFRAIFASIDPGWSLNAAMATVGTVYGTLTAILYAALDFQFIRNTTVGATLLLYIPASLSAFYLVGTVFSLQVAAALPTVGITALYFWRFWFVLTPQLLRGERVRGNSLALDRGLHASLVAGIGRRSLSVGSVSRDPTTPVLPGTAEAGATDGSVSRRGDSEGAAVGAPVGDDDRSSSAEAKRRTKSYGAVL